MSLNYRWLLQAAAFIGCIYFFLQIWERSKSMLLRSSATDWLIIGLCAVLFLLCFFVMGITSYLKQKVNGTLKNAIPLFENVIEKFNLIMLAQKKE